MKNKSNWKRITRLFYGLLFSIMGGLLALTSTVSAKDRPLLSAHKKSRLPVSNNNNRVIDLRGTWTFQLDPSGDGIKSKWFSRQLNDQISLPGTTDEAHKGTLTTNREPGRFTRVYQYYGRAWYQHEISIPANWAGKHIEFLMERTKLTTVWVDTTLVSSQSTLAGKQIYDLTAYLKPGRHRLTVMVNNGDRPPIGDPHQISDQTQTNWNGIIGDIRLQAFDPVWMKQVDIFPDVAAKQVRVRVKFGSLQALTPAGKVSIVASTWNVPNPQKLKELTFTCRPDTSGYFEATYPLGNRLQLWDEFSPALYHFDIRFSATGEGKPFSDSREISTGIRDFKAQNTQFNINGKTIFIRGKHDACVFPLTGYPPMTVDGWVKVFKIAKSYGINLYRFHTWCPPEAAFKAADIVGMYLQPELPIWGSIGRPTEVRAGDVEQHIDNDPVTLRTIYLQAEGRHMLRDYGNYGSFVMFALGNELTGSKTVMADLVRQFRAYDSRHLFAQGSNNFLNAPEYAPGDDWWATTMTGGHYTAGNYRMDTRGKDVRSSYPVDTVGHINNWLAGTTYDYRRSIEGVSVPVIGHEIGQYQTYPNFDEIKKFTGVVRARNFEIFKERLEAAGMGDQAAAFFKASGALAVLCYKEEIETAMRTPGFGGFHLLDLQDFPGQGTALVGILDAFMDSKGLITPEQWRQFCSPVVPLVKMKSFTWRNTEVYSAEAEVANYGPAAFEANPNWTLTDAGGHIVRSGKLSPLTIPQGKITSLGAIQIDLKSINTPQQLVLSLQVGKHLNTYPVWVYPQQNRKLDSAGIITATQLNAQVINRLEQGETVVLFPSAPIMQESVRGNFQADFWSYTMFKKYSPPGTMGILCDPGHPALSLFPTQNHSNWQWWRLVRYSPVMVLDKLPRSFRPIVQVIDNLERNHKLGLVYEAKVGKGKLLVCSIPLVQLQQYPEGLSLYQSLLHYVHTAAFNPVMQLDRQTLSAVLKVSE